MMSGGGKGYFGDDDTDYGKGKVRQNGWEILLAEYATNIVSSLIFLGQRWYDDGLRYG